MHVVPVVAAVGLGKIAICVVQVPLPAAHASVVARRGHRVLAELRHQPRVHVIDQQVATHAKLFQLDFLRAEHLARSADGVVRRMVEVEVVVGVDANLRGEVLRAQRAILGARVAVQPGPVGVRKRRHGVDRLGLRRPFRKRCCRSRSGVRRGRCRLCGNSFAAGRRSLRFAQCIRIVLRGVSGIALLELGLQLIDARLHRQEFFQDFVVRLHRCLRARVGTRARVRVRISDFRWTRRRSRCEAPAHVGGCRGCAITLLLRPSQRRHGSNQNQNRYKNGG